MTARAARTQGLADAPDDASVVGAIADGDLSGLGLLFDRHGDAVRRLLGRVGVPSSDIDDLTQETFLVVAATASSFQRELPVRPWLLGIAAMLARRHRHAAARLVGYLRVWAASALGAVIPPPHEEVEGALQVERAQRAFEGLATHHREVFALVVLEGLSGKEVAAALGIPVATVFTRLHYARAALRRALGLEQPP